jgi:glycosyltransferase involved in cell wall biosynthesis
MGIVEIIVSDGGSTDNTVEILKKYTDKIIWWSEKDKGYADAVKKGFEVATGDIFAIQSSDDYYLKDSFDKINSAFFNKPDVVLICGREAIQEPNGHIFRGYELPELITPKSFLLDHPFPGIFQHTTFFRRGIYEKVWGMRSGFDLCADADLFYRMLHFGKGYFLNDYIAVYQKHNFQRTKTQVEKFENQILKMVTSCRNDKYYNEQYSMSDKDYFLFSSFINLFYLQFTDAEKAQITAKEIVNNLINDERTKNLAEHIIKSKRNKEQIATFAFNKKYIRILNRLFKRYVFKSKYSLTKTEDIPFRIIINADWWENGITKG